jgi:hypothetical protein
MLSSGEIGFGYTTVDFSIRDSEIPVVEHHVYMIIDSVTRLTEELL